MKILDRYILKELLAPFLLSVAAVFFLLLTQQMLRMVELLIDKGVGLLAVAELFIYLLPSFLVLTLPIAVLISSISAFNRLSADYEIVAFKSAGIGIYRLLKPVALFSIVICAFVYYLSIVAMPWSGFSLKDLAIKLLKKQASIGIQEGAFNELIPNMVIYVDQMPTFNDLRGVFLYDLRVPDEPQIILAKQGTIMSDPATSTILFSLTEGSLHQKGKSPQQYQRILFSSYQMKLDLNVLLGQPHGVNRSQASFAEIKKNIQATGGKDIRWLRSLQDYYRNYALPLASFIFGILGISLGIHTRRAGRLGGFALGAVVVVLYYLLMITGDFLLATRLFTPFLAAWFPNLILGLATLGITLVTAKEGYWNLK